VDKRRIGKGSNYLFYAGINRIRNADFGMRIKTIAEWCIESPFGRGEGVG